MKDQFIAFVVARPGRIRDGLIALLRAIPEIGTIEPLGDDISVLARISHHPQTLVLLDASLMNQDIWSAIKQVKSRQPPPRCKCLVLADNSFQQRMAIAAGADEVLLTGFPAYEFFATVENLLNQSPASQGQAKEAARLN